MRAATVVLSRPSPSFTTNDCQLDDLRSNRLMESGMNTFGNKIFGAIIGSTIFFGVGIALAHAGSLVV